MKSMTKMKMLNPLDHPICYSHPLRIRPSGWLLHVPFAMFLVDILRPEVIVELGTHNGVSYCAFCQAVKELDLSTRAYAVDSWEGDSQSGFYGPEVLSDLREHHDPLYGGFSELIQSTFDDALTHFKDGSIDLLHIDGYHTYEAVHHDWNNWKPKLSNQGIVLFHDINVREGNFGVWKLWEELKGEYSHFEMLHGHGLGILMVEDNQLQALDVFSNLTPAQISLIQNFFWQLGTRVESAQEVRRLTGQLSTKDGQIDKHKNQLNVLKGSLKELEGGIQEKRKVEKDLQSQLINSESQIEKLTVQAAQKDKSIQEIKAQLELQQNDNKVNRKTISELENRLQQEQITLKNLNNKLLEIYASTAWKFVKLLWKIRLALFPLGSKRERIIQSILSLVRRKNQKQGKSASLPKQESGKHKLKQHKGISRSPGESYTSEVGKDIFQFDSKNNLERFEEFWNDYLAEKERLKKRKQEYISSLNPKKPHLIDLSNQSHIEVINQIVLPKSSHPEVSIIIPVMDNLQLTLECLLSIVNNTEEMDYEIIIVDDASKDDSEKVLTRINNLVYLKNDQNIGFLKSCNIGKISAKGDYLLILNNDVQVQQGWLTGLVEPMRGNNEVGAVGPKVIFPNGRLQEAGARITPDGSTELIGLRDDPNLPRYNYKREVDYCSGVCLLLRADDYKDTDVFDTDFAPAYCEDVDLCLRLKNQHKKILYNPESTIIHHLSATTDKNDKNSKISQVVKNTQKLIERWSDSIQELNKVRLISFYLPQYHAIPENDIWWGKGFTEWKNVGKARPNFVGHRQPRVPADLGYYDLRVQDVMDHQAELAKRYGIYGFCYYYYWFNGKKLLDFPIERILETGRPDIPFCLCWANENWTRTWDGQDDHQLISQNHSDEDDLNFIADLSRFFRHPSYIRIQDKPFFLIYRIDLFPDIQKTVEIWRDYCRQNGIGEIYLAMVQSFQQAKKMSDPIQWGFDAAVEFPPHDYGKKTEAPGRIINPNFIGSVYDYRETFNNYIKKPIQPYTNFRTVMPSWDNTPRRQNNSTIFINSKPAYYQVWLENIIQLTKQQNHGDEQIVFLNAWNEWGEGNYLEPDLYNGHSYLEATKNALDAGILNNK